MPKRGELRITKRAVDALEVEDRDAVFWDRDLPGFGVRVYPSGRKVYVVQARGPCGPRRATVGRHGKLVADDARGKAAAMIDRIKRGEEARAAPAKPALTVRGLSERYMSGHVAMHCKPRTMELYRSMLDNHILPALGTLSVEAVEREHVASLHHRLRGTPRSANAALRVLSHMFGLAETWGFRPRERNPCRSVRRYKDVPRERYLTREEYRRLGRVLREAEAEGKEWPPAIAAIRLLLLTGCRRDEILTLRWDDVDRVAGELRLREGKTGPRMVPLTPEIETVLAGIPHVAGNPWVIVGHGKGERLKYITLIWYRLRARAELDDVRLHDLRHSYASRALALGENLSMIGRLLGHSKVGTTARYAHLVRDTERRSAAKIGGSIARHLPAKDIAA